MLRVVGFAAIFVLPFFIGCDSDAGCAELQAICDGCPDTAEGLIAQESCQGTVDSQDDESCLDRIDKDAYGEFGCEE